MPLPFKSEVLEALSNNYKSTLKRTLSLSHNAAKNSELKQTLQDTFAELLHEEWLVAVDSNLLDAHEWFTMEQQLQRVCLLIRLYWQVKIC